MATQTSETGAGPERRRQTRTKLPEKSKPYQMNIWNILKQSIGKDLSRIAMPVQFNEPLSFLQRTAEYAEYNHLLRIASFSDNPVERMEYVVAFAVSSSSSSSDRLRKPFNPLEGETYELNRSEVGMQFYAEQISHHPPVTAFHCEAPEVFTFHGTVEPRTRFLGRHIEVLPKGIQILHIPNFNEYYTWQIVPFYVRNIMSGKVWIEIVGSMEITNHATGLKTALQFRKALWTPQGKEAYRIDGYIFDRNGAKLRAIYGKWSEAIYSVSVENWEKYLADQKELMKNYKKNSKKQTKESSKQATTSLSSSRPATATNGSAPVEQMNKLSMNNCDSATNHTAAEANHVDGDDDEDEEEEEPPTWSFVKYDLNLPGQALLWQVTERPSASADYFNFTAFALMLNEIGEQEALGSLPPTDSRFRPDVRMLENGDLEGAEMEKHRLEDKQRERRKLAKKSVSSAQQSGPLWFTRSVSEVTGKDDWVFNKTKYLARDWSKSPELFF